MNTIDLNFRDNSNDHFYYLHPKLAMQAANKGLMECLVDIYEPEWPGQDQIPEKADVLENAWEDICHKLNDQVTIPLSTYLSQFSEIKVSVGR